MNRSNVCRVMMACAGLLLCGVPSTAATAVSTDGEATVYVKGDFSADFDLVYRAKLEPAPNNRSWSTVGIMLLGTVNPGPGVSVGLASGDPDGRTITGFTSAILEGGKNRYRVVKTDCGHDCIISLHGTRTTLEARIGDHFMERWQRSSIPLRDPYAQLNGEVSRAGDSIAASLTPVTATSGSQPLAAPACAFTTRGVTVHGTGPFTFSGTNRSGAPVTYLALATGRPIESCAKL